MPNLPTHNRPKFLREKKREPTSNQAFLNSPAWRKARKARITEYPLCEVHLSKDQYIDCTFGGHTDHIVPTEQGGHLFAHENLMTLCASCHNRKSGLEMHEKCLVEKLEFDGYFVTSDESKQLLINRLAAYL